MLAAVFLFLADSVCRFFMIEDQPQLQVHMSVNYPFFRSVSQCPLLSFHIAKYDPSTKKLKTVANKPIKPSSYYYVEHCLHSLAFQHLFMYYSPGEPHKMFWVMKLAQVCYA